MKVETITDTELQAVTYLDAKAASAITFNRDYYEQHQQEPVTGDRETENRIREYAKDYRQGVLAGYRALGERAGLPWGEFRRRFPTKAEALATAIVAQGRADAAVRTSADGNLDKALADQAKAKARLDALVTRARDTFRTSPDESYPAWVEAHEARTQNASEAIKTAAAKLAEAADLEAKAKAARQEALEAGHAAQQAFNRVVARLREHGRPATSFLTATHLTDIRLNDWIDSGCTEQEAADWLFSLLDRYLEVFDKHTGDQVA